MQIQISSSCCIIIGQAVLDVSDHLISICHMSNLQYPDDVCRNCYDDVLDFSILPIGLTSLTVRRYHSSIDRFTNLRELHIENITMQDLRLTPPRSITKLHISGSQYSDLDFSDTFPLLDHLVLLVTEGNLPDIPHIKHFSALRVNSNNFFRRMTNLESLCINV